MEFSQDIAKMFLNRRSKREFNGALTNIVSFDTQNQGIKDNWDQADFEEKDPGGDEEV